MPFMKTGFKSVLTQNQLSFRWSASRQRNLLILLLHTGRRFLSLVEMTFLPKSYKYKMNNRTQSAISHSPLSILNCPLSIIHYPFLRRLLRKSPLVQTRQAITNLFSATCIPHYPLSIIHYPLSILHYQFFRRTLSALTLLTTLAFLTACTSQKKVT